MLPHEVIRAAATLIREGGHSQGSHARDALGRDVALFGHTRSGEEVDVSRAEINPAAISFSLYGALAAVLRTAPAGMTGVIWPMVRDEALRAMDGKSTAGGTNHLHPLVLLNEHMDTDKEGACAFLERCALLVEPKPKPKDEPNDDLMSL